MNNNPDMQDTQKHLRRTQVGLIFNKIHRQRHKKVDERGSRRSQLRLTRNGSTRSACKQLPRYSALRSALDFMAKSNGKVYVNGTRLTKLLCDANISSGQLANALQVSPTTIGSYESSDIRAPHNAESKKLRQIADYFSVPIEELILDEDSIDYGMVELKKTIENAEQRFAGVPGNCRSIAGTWHASSEDVPIPGQLEYTHTIPWDARSQITQVGNTFVARGLDKDEDVVLAEGILLEGGNFVRFNYFLTHDRLRQYGIGLLEFRGDGKTMEGYFLGRDAGQSRNGLILAKLVFRLEQNVKPG